MANYVILDGRKFVQLDDGSTAEVVVCLSLEGGTLTKLPANQIEQLRTPHLPDFYPMPANQVADLKQVSVNNFPGGFGITNFPLGFGCTNMPSTFPLPAAQEGLLTSLNNWATTLDKGSGNLSANTLRVVLPTNQPRIPISEEDVKMSPIALSASGDQIIITPAAGKALRISDITFTAASLVSVQFKQGTTAQGQTTLSGVMPVLDHQNSYSRPLALAVDRSLVINLGSAVAVNGYVCWWEV